DRDFLALYCQSLVISFEHRLERLLVLPLGIFRRELLHAVEHECHLHIHRLLAPQRAIVIEGRDALRQWHEIGRALVRHPRNECDDGLLRGAVVPGRQSVRLSKSQSRQQKNGADEKPELPAKNFHFSALTFFRFFTPAFSSGLIPVVNFLYSCAITIFAVSEAFRQQTPTARQVVELSSV